MINIWRTVDQFVAIGEDIVVGPTDIDDKAARIIARGRMLGGPDDGGTFNEAHELSRGQSFPIGPCVIVTLLDVAGEQVKLGVLAPSHVDILTKEDTGGSRGARQKLKDPDLE